MVQTTEELRNGIAAELEESADALELSSRVDADYLIKLLEGDCIIVDLHIEKWNARAKWTPEEWGIEGVGDIEDPDTRDAVREMYSWGEKYLLPRQILNRLNALAQSGRGALYGRSFGTTWGRVMPVKMYKHWKERNESLRAEWEELVDDIADNLEYHIEAVAKQYRLQAVVAYRRFVGVNVNDPDTVPSEEWVSDYVDRIIDLVPSSDDVRSRFKWEAHPKLLVMPDVAEATRQNVEELRREGNEAEIQKCSIFWECQ